MCVTGRLLITGAGAGVSRKRRLGAPEERREVPGMDTLDLLYTRSTEALVGARRVKRRPPMQPQRMAMMTPHGDEDAEACKGWPRVATRGFRCPFPFIGV